MNIYTFKDPRKWIESMVEEIQTHLSTATHVGIAGGQTPKPLYEQLAEDGQEHLEHAELWLLDERIVPLDDPDSNHHMISETELPDHVAAFHYFDTELDEKEMIEQYRQELSTIPDQSLDLVIIGIGAGAHIASIFPNTEAITSNQSALLVNAKGQEVTRRATVSLDFLKKAKHTIVIAKGQEDAQILDMLESEDGNEHVDTYPALYLQELSSVSIFLF